MMSVYKSCCGRVQQRWVLAVMGFLCTTIRTIMESCLSLTLTEMVGKTNISSHSDETCVYPSDRISLQKTTRNIAGVYDWDEELQGLILSSCFWGLLVTQMLGGMLAAKFGGKYVLGLAILEMSILTLLTPLAVQTGGAMALIIIRFFIGCGNGLVFPATNELLSHWAPPSERSKIVTLIYSGTAIGSLIAFVISGLLADNSTFGWRLIFYVFGSCGIVWFLFSLVLCYNNPDEHPMISETEKKFLRDTISEHKHKNVPPVPWRHILRSAPFWAFVISGIGQDWGCVMMASDLPKFISSILKLPLSTNGALMGLSAMSAGLLAIPISWIADWLINSGRMSRTNVRKLFTTIGSFGPGVFLVAGMYVGCDRILKAACVSITIVLVGPIFSGLRVNVLDLSPNYSSTLSAVAGTFASLSGVTAPYVAGILTPNQTAGEWKLVFWIVGVVYWLTSLVFIFWASGECQFWNDPEFLIREQEERKNIARGEQPQKLTKSTT